MRSIVGMPASLSGEMVVQDFATYLDAGTTWH